MDKTAIRDFAVKARYKLISEIVTKANMIGISEEGVKSPLPQSNADIQYFDIGGDKPYELKKVDFSKRSSLIDAINARVRAGQSQKDAFQDTVEEIAYTWFNRIIAVRFMEVNGYLPSGIRVLSSEEQGKKEPDIVTNYYDADLNINQNDEIIIQDLKRRNKQDDLFKFLFIKQCNKLGEILPFLFEKTEDYCELMLSISYTDEQGIVNQLINSVSEDDFKEAVEIIGWMYQYYIAQKKEEVFKGLKNNTKITKSTLPSATQIFTPDWIVKYMADNTLGKLWIESHKGSGLKNNCEYYLEPAEQSDDVKTKIDEINKYYKNKKLEDITFIDPCCGSGHILVYAFDLFYKIYEEQGYVASDIPTLIVKNNLYGIDVDKRAMQLTCFAISMKARSYDRRYFKKAYNKPNIIDVKESNYYLNTAESREVRLYLDKKLSSNEVAMIDEILEKFREAELYGSLIKDFSYTKEKYQELYEKLKNLNNSLEFDIEGLIVRNALNEHILPLTEEAIFMSDKYDVVVTNPPYAGNAKLPDIVGKYLQDNYPKTKFDLFSAFIERNCEYSSENGHLGIMCPYVWMFIQSYEDLRKDIINYNNLTSLVQLEYGGFAEAVVPICTFTFRKLKTGEKGEYIRLEEFKGPDIQGIKTLEAVKNKNCGYRYSTKIDNMINIPGTPIAYWISENFVKTFSVNKKLVEVANPRQGLATGENNRFIRQWFEVELNKTLLNSKTKNDFIESGKKWAPYNKGGNFRKWYGNNDYVVNWENDGLEIKNFKDERGKLRSRPQNLDYYFKESITWSLISSSDVAFRYKPTGHIFDIAGMSLFASDDSKWNLLGILNSNIVKSVLKVIAPTLNFQVGDIARIPIVINDESKDEIDRIVKDNIEISKADWDMSETSWDFTKHPFIEYKKGSLTSIYKLFKQVVNDRFNKLKENEKTLNQILIDNYKLQEEVSYDVLSKDITITSLFDSRTDVPEYMKNNTYVMTKQDVVKDIISYIIGCIFGRYSVDADGVAYAGGNFNRSKYQTIIPDTDNIIPINDDEYFDDDIINRIVEFIRKVYGEEYLNENLQFIADALGNSGESPREVIRNYMLKDFFKDHCQKYQNRPIYWLFDSGKENGFKALVYLHRYNEDTIAKMRAEYLHKIQRVYESELNRMQDTIENSTDNKEVAVARKKKEKFTKQLLETKEYDEVLGHVALQRIPLDLDDGVKVNYQKFQNIDYIKNGKSVKKNLLVNIFK